MKYLIFTSLLLYQLITYSQSLKGVIIDSMSNEKLSYANLVIKGKPIGAYSNENGCYDLNLSKTTVKDTLIISLIGYKNKAIPMSQFKEEKTYQLNFQLIPKTEHLKEVLILDKKKRYSHNKIQLSTGSRKQTYPSSLPYGSETASFIENPKHKKGKLTELHLKFKSRINNDYKTYKTYYRLAFYDVNHLGFPGALLHFENIIIKPKIDTKNYKIDLEDKAIPFFKNGIFIGIETIKPDDVTIESSMYLTTPNVLYTHTKKNLEYSRFRSNEWHKNKRKSVFKKKFYTAPFIKVKVLYEKED
ncbi:carboxypeptidase-like regulatory domain-containing protein [Winogradskyella vidalii]|uniref:carboxypeptidase-like regulatory domain-containing protein n=1 Tax=Winogradskyella vidalii TaxID=2615024 RepID=UPI0015C9EACB|nr:carboxypeptidase-like regulatory domain-containing protein [Winogradskyella vidalii]